jgi:hypothetical protein
MWIAVTLSRCSLPHLGKCVDPRWETMMDIEQPTRASRPRYGRQSSRYETFETAEEAVVRIFRAMNRLATNTPVDSAAMGCCG